MDLHVNSSFFEDFPRLSGVRCGVGQDEAKKCIFSHFYIKTFERKKSSSETMDFHGFSMCFHFPDALASSLVVDQVHHFCR